MFETLLHDKTVHAIDLVHFRYGESLMVADQPDRAVREFLAVTTTPHGEPGLVTMAQLRAGQALDLAGKRDEAMARYRVVLTRPNVYDAHDAAKQGLREPYKPRKNSSE
jgi:hypothetical protein